jgi:hypothetical protein
LQHFPKAVDSIVSGIADQKQSFKVGAAPVDSQAAQTECSELQRASFGLH